MRHTSDDLLSSNNATSFMAFFSSSLTRIVTSQIFFSPMPPQQKISPAQVRGLAGEKSPAPDAGRGDDRKAHMSGGLLFGGALANHLGDLVGAKLRHLVAPLVNCGLGNAERFRQFLDAAELFDGVFRVHAPIISMLNVAAQAYLFRLLIYFAHALVI